jgi:serine/threonine protein kinase
MTDGPRIIPKKLVRDNPSVVLDEINVLKGLDHPNIVHVWDHFESRDKYYLTFELAVGGELFDRITERGRFTEKDAAECIRCVVVLLSCCPIPLYTPVSCGQLASATHQARLQSTA